AQILFRDSHADRGPQLDRAYRTLVGNHGQDVCRFGGVVASRLAFDPEQPAGRRRCSRADLHARPPQRVVELNEVGTCAQWDTQRGEPLLEWCHRVVADRRDLPVVQVESRERLEDVVQLAAGELDRYVDRARYRSLVLEVADATLVEDHTLHRQLCRLRRDGLLRARGSGQCSDQQCTDEKTSAHEYLLEERRRGVPDDRACLLDSAVRFLDLEETEGYGGPPFVHGLSRTVNSESC